MENENKNLPAVWGIDEVDKAIETGNFESLTNNNFLSIDDPQAKGVIKDLFNQVKRANPKLNEFSFSLLTLFSAVMEVWGLTQDRNKYLEFQKEQLPKDLEILEKEKAFLEDDLKFKKRILEIKVAQYEGIVSDATPYEKADEAIDLINDLTHKRKLVLQAEKNIRSIDIKIDSAKTSIELKHYNISSGGKIFTNMENNLLSKYERIGKLLDQYNLNPESVGLSHSGNVETVNTASTQFAAFSNFGGDKKDKGPTN